ncbi:MAG: hypothetical protein DHS20C18_19400 [Saprospiraceae bacterium]|nr:MAG: hypothetical protein DHS20C18_19400 [Saprospiraceae bacterium]
MAIWLVINLFQAGLTPLDPDEAYYWMYASSLDWGYFDHPPMVAVLIKLGTSLFDGIFGVRLFTVLLQLGFLYILWLLCDKPTDKWSISIFFALLLSMPLLQVYGFIATPDAPLLFFSALFLWIYGQFLKTESWVNTLFLGAVMAALLYSKYHGVLLIFFTVLSNLKLLTRPRFYLAGIFGIFLFFPHLYWQYQHDFPSFRYHLKGRDDPYQLKHTTNYLINQFVVFGPLVFPLLLRAMWKKFPPREQIEKTYFFILIGFWVFFFWTTFKGHVEPQWTIILCIPLVVFAVKQYRADQKLFRWYLSLGGISLVLILILRIALTIPGLNLGNLNRQFRHQEWVTALEDRAAGNPVVFQNSYRDASIYTFYTGQQAFTFTDIDYRKNQFDLWNLETVLNNKRVLLAGKEDWECRNCEWLTTDNKKILVREIAAFQPVWKLEAKVVFPEGQTLKKGEIPLELAFSHPYPYAVQLQNPEMPVGFQGLFYQNAEIQDSMPLNLLDTLLTIPVKDTVKVKAMLQVPEQLEGSFDFYIGLQFLEFPPVFCSKATKVDIE